MTGNVTSVTAKKTPINTYAVVNSSGDSPAATNPVVTNPLPLVQQKQENDIGTKVESDKGKPQKTGESVGERLTRYYTAYKNCKTQEEKEAFLKRYITGHYATLKNLSEQERINLQLADYKKLLSNTTDPDDYEMLAKQISVLEKQNQVSGAKSATVDQKVEELKIRGYIGVSKDVHNCDDDNQIELTHLVVNSKVEEAIKIGASHTSELADKNQVNAVQIYQKAEISETAQKDVDKILIDQYSDYAVKNQVEIHKVMSASKFSETVEYAASNIYKLDKTNQASAVQVTVDTGDKEAIKAAAANWSKYDTTIQDDGSTAQSKIGNIINNTNYGNLADAQEIKATLADAQNNPAQQSNSTSSSELAEIENSNNLTEKIDKILSSKTITNQSKKIEEAVKGASETQKLKLLEQNSTNMDIIRAILYSNPSLEILSKIMELLGDNTFDEKNKTELMKTLGKSGVFKGENSRRLKLLDKQLQIDYINLLSAEDLNYINKDTLSSDAQKAYEDRVKDLNITTGEESKKYKKFGVLGK